MIEAPALVRPPPPTSVPPSHLLGGKIAALRRKHLVVELLTGVALVVAVALELLALAMFLDWWLELPRGARAVSLLLQLAIVGFMFARYVLRPIVQPPDDDDLALMVERNRPEFHSRLIAALQLTRPAAVAPGASPALVEALVEQTEALAKPIDFQRVVPTERLKKFGALAVFVLLVGALAMGAAPSSCADLLKRVVLLNVPVPRKTRVLVLEPNKVIGRGDSVRLEAYVQGIIPSTGKAVVKYKNRREQPYALEQNREEKIRFGRTLESVQDSFTYQIFLGDGVSPEYEVKAIPRPTVSTIECEQEFPAYTKLKSMRRSLGDLTLLAGSRLKLKATATKDIVQAAIKMVGRESEIPLRVQPEQPRLMTGELLIPTAGMNGFSLRMLDTEGMESRDAAVYRVEIVPDKAPAVRITYPERKETLVTRQATLLVGLDVADDFAIAKLRLRYKVDTVDKGAEQAIELDLGEEAPQRLRRRHEWKLNEQRPLLTEGSLIEYWLEAEDNNDATGPGVGVSEHQVARVVSEAEKRADLLNRAGDYLGSLSDVASDQEKLNRTLGALILEKTGIR